jgi:hypothetical protein
MESRLTREGTALRLDFTVSPLVRLAGVPFLGMTAYLLYNLVMSIADVVRGHAGAGEMLGGQILLAVLIASFGVPGLFTFMRKWMVIHKDRGMIDEITNFLVFSRTRRTPLAQYQRLRAVLSLNSRGSGGGSSSVTYDVELLGGKKTAAQLGLPFENHTKSDPRMDEDNAAEADP